MRCGSSLCRTISIVYHFSLCVDMGAIKRVAVIGAGPAGAIAVDALAQEGVFDVIRVFERREKAGGCW